jgi:hypothetical protein
LRRRDCATTEGMVQVGKRANLVLLDADPLADIANTRRVSAVLLRDSWFRSWIFRRTADHSKRFEPIENNLISANRDQIVAKRL